ncbi:MAG TPA: DsbA family protein [Acetobacteraceae bacterium]|jgi:protein-disulfide isomerase|nr:DsbA family protein [Acetobacteraceae bacterium]
MTPILRLATFCLTVCLLLATAHAGEFTPAQRAEIVQIMRDALKQDPSILRDAVNAMQADDGDRQQAAARAAIAAARGKLVNPADPIAGDPGGDVTIVEFFDTRCPYCRKLEPTMSDLLARDHRVRLVYKDLPILGPDSVLGSKALLAAQKQGRYEKLREAIMSAPPDTDKRGIQAIAQNLGLDWERMKHDMDDPAVAARLQANLTLAHELGIEGTPALVIGGNLIPGAIDLADLQSAVAAARDVKQGAREGN